MAIAFIQEFPIVDGDMSTTNYDAVAAKLDLQGASPQGLLLHSAGFDHDAGVFRIFDVWQTREDGERFMTEQLEPIIESMIAAATASGEDFAPPAREGWYELHDTMSG
jgi:hypothetical protein